MCATVKANNELRHLALEPLLVHASRPDWTLGLLTALALSLAFGLVQSWDDARAIDEARFAAEVRAANEKAERLLLDGAPQIRLEGVQFRCRNFRIRDEWIHVMAAECERLGGLLRAARAAP